MKKLLLTLSLCCIASVTAWSQCVYTCSNYAVSPITHSVFPSGSTNITPTFTNPVVGVFADDGSIGPIPIGFNFSFYCNSYSNVYICSNGFIQFDYQPLPWPTQYVHPTQSLPDPTVPNGMIAFNMTDMDPGVGGTITYTTVGTAPNRMFIVTYSNVPCFSSSTDLNTGQIVLYETSNLIEIHTTSAKPDVNQGQLGGMQGIEDIYGVNFATPPGRNANTTWGALSNNTAYQFAPYTSTPPPLLSGNLTSCEGVQNSFNALPAPGALSYAWSLPPGWTGTSTTTALTATPGASGNVSVAAVYTCGVSTPITVSVTVNPAPVISVDMPDPQIVCEGTTFTLTASGAANYSVLPTPVSGSSPLVVTNSGITTYTLIGSGANGCLSLNTVTASITSEPTPTVTVNSGAICLGQSFTMLPNGANSYVVSSGFLTVNPAAAGIYQYTVTGVGLGANMCPSMLPAISSLTVNPNPVVTITAPKTTICKNESLLLTATGADTYSWSGGQTTPAISVSPAVTSVFNVTATTNAGCKGTKVITIIVSECVGINEPGTNKSGVSVYPNPASGIFNVKFDNAPGTDELQVYNSLGQLVLTSPVKLQTVEVDITTQPDGLYYLKLKGSDQVIFKMVKE